jgi:hypothetical protein
MKIPLLTLGLLLALVGSVPAENTITDEDRSRFVERLYEKPEPGLRAPSDYVAMAKKAAHSQFGDKIQFEKYAEGIVTRRTYHDAPKADRDMICVAFVYKGSMSTGGLLGPGFIYSGATPARPMLVVLMRRDLSKVYINVVHFKRD